MVINQKSPIYIILPMQNIYANINKIPNIAIDAKDISHPNQ